MSTVNSIFGALADQRRRMILEYLKSAPRSAGDIASKFEISWPAISRHLRILREAGLVTVFQSGRSRQYSLNSLALEAALDNLTRLAARATLSPREQPDHLAPTVATSGREAFS